MSTDTLLSTAKLKMYAVCNGNTDSGVFFWDTKLEMILTEITFTKRLFQLKTGQDKIIDNLLT